MVCKICLARLPDTVQARPAFAAFRQVASNPSGIARRELGVGKALKGFFGGVNDNGIARLVHRSLSAAFLKRTNALVTNSLTLESPMPMVSAISR